MASYRFTNLKPDDLEGPLFCETFQRDRAQDVTGLRCVQGSTLDMRLSLKLLETCYGQLAA